MDPATTATAAKWTAVVWRAVGGGIISGIFKPGQVRREGMAAIDVEYNRALALTQVKLDAQDIIDGKKSYSIEQKRLISHDISRSFVQPIPASEETQASAPMQHAWEVMAAEKLKSEINVAQAAIHAEAELASETSEPPGALPSADWVTRWRDSAEKVSEDEMQQLWGRILAGEIKQPGTYSLRALEVIRNLSKEDAELISRISNYRSNDFIFKPEGQDFFGEKGFHFSTLLELQDLGLIGGVESIGLSLQLKASPEERLNGFFAFTRYAVSYSSEESGKSLDVPVYTVSKMGKQIISLAKADDDLSYIFLLKDHLVKNGCKASVHEITEINSNGEFKYKREEVEFNKL